MALNEIIRKRKSIRKYDLTVLDDAVLETVRSQIENVKPLFTDIKFSIEIANKTRGPFGIKAPHYLIFTSEEKEGALENIGFVGQQMDLFFSASGLGSCWLGGSKPEEARTPALPFVICMAFGKPAEPLHREPADFNRKSLAEISEGTDGRLEAARLAPSAVNAQNWFFVAGEGKIRCYRKKPSPLLGFMFNSLGRVDMGIALCHSAEESDSFHFIRETDAPERKGHVYIGTVTGE